VHCISAFGGGARSANRYDRLYSLNMILEANWWGSRFLKKSVYKYNLIAVYVRFPG